MECVNFSKCGDSWFVYRGQHSLNFRDTDSEVSSDPTETVAGIGSGKDLAIEKCIFHCQAIDEGKDRKKCESKCRDLPL